MRRRTARIVVGKTVDADLAGDLDAMVDAWERSERGEEVYDHVVSFGSVEAMAAALSPERLRLLRHLRDQPARSVRALSIGLGRDYRRVHGDVAALEDAGLVERDAGGVWVTADRVQVDIDLTRAA